MVVADLTQVDNDVVFVIEGTANLLPHFETLKTNYIEPTLEDFNNGPVVEPDGFGGEYGSNQYCLLLYGTAASAPDAAAHCVIHTRDVFKFHSFLQTLRFDGGCGEEHSLLAEGLSLAMQVFDDLKTTRKPQSAPAKRSCIVIANSPPYNIPSRECLNSSYNTTSDQLAEMMAVNGINLSIIAPRKIPALQKIFEKSRRDENAHSLSKDYSKDPKHMVCVQGFLLPVKSSPVPKESPPVAMDTTSTVATQPKQEPPITTSGGSPNRPSDAGSPVNRSGKKKNGRPSPSQAQPLTTTASLPPGPFPIQTSTPPNVVLSSVVPTKAHGAPSNSQVLPVQPGRPPAPYPVARQVPKMGIPVMPPVNLDHSATRSAPIPGPQPQPQVPNPPIESIAPNPASQQRALAWTGHLEWQDTIRSDPSSPQRITRSLACHVSVAPGDILKTDKWPSKLIMQLIPQNLLSSLGPLLQSSKTVAFHFAANDPDSLKALYRVMASTGVKFAGCVHFPPAHQCEVKVLLLIFSPRKKAFVGLIPHDQGSFVIGIRSVVAGHRSAQIKKFQQAQAQAQAAQAQAAQAQAAQAQAAQAQAQAAQVQVAQAQVAQAQAVQAQAAQAQAAQAQAAQAQAQNAQLQHRNLLLHQLQQQSQTPGFVPTTATQFAQQSQGVQPPAAGPGLPGVTNPISQQTLLSSAGSNILAGSQNQGIEGMVSSSQSSLASSLGIPAASVVGSSVSGGVTTSLQSMAMDQQPDGLRPQQPMYQQQNLDKQKQLQLLAQARQQQQQLQQQLQQQQLQAQQKAQHQAQQQAQNAQQAQQAKAQAQAQQVQAQAQAQAAQAQSLRHLLQQNPNSAQTAQQWQLQRQQQQLLMLRQQQAAQQMNQQQMNPAQMSQVQAQMTQAQMVQSQAQMTPAQASQSQMMQQQLSQPQSLFPEDVTLIELLQPQQQ